MKRKLLTQMRAEWRANIWMALEMLLVSVVLFVLADKIYTVVATINEPLGFNTEHCYILRVRELSEAAPEYREYENQGERWSDLLTLKQRLQARPEISAVTMSSNAIPYNPNNSTNQLDIDTFSMADAPLLRRAVDPDFFKVFRIEGAEGQSAEELGEILQKERIIPSDNALLRKAGIRSLKPLYGKQMVLGGVDTLTLRASFKPMKYSDYQTVHGWAGASMFENFNPRYYLGFMEGLSVRVKDFMDKDFMERLMADADGDLKVGNWYVASVESFDKIREDYNRNAKAETRNTVVCALFLLLNIFLGILGTFWFRTQQRNREIALRMVSGATKIDIFRRIVGEGEILLLLVTPIAIVIDFLLTHYEFTSWYDGYFEPVHFCVSVLVAWILMALMIAIGIYFPARRAMTISPAVAMKTD
ncbi:MAG: ABC transporter permease [Muribaculaceae bacterium]|nr:ABC transporter permease [Muribaculaceae bacterium]